MSEWRPIESWTQDRRPFIGYSVETGMVGVCWLDENGGIQTVGVYAGPTHWMPLPDPPEDE